MKKSSFAKVLLSFILLVSFLTDTKAQGHGVFAASGGFHIERRNSALAFLVEGGHLFDSSPVFLTTGAGLTFGYVRVSSISTETTNLNIPINAGYILGNKDKFHATLGGGLMFNYLLSAKIDKEKINLSGSDRISWNANARFTFSYSDVGLYVQYGIPFESGVSGILMYGFFMGL